MNKKIYIPALLLILAFSSWLNLSGIGWGVPSSKRIELMVPGKYLHESFFTAMKQARDSIYAISGGSPVGRVKGEPGSKSPILQDMRLDSDINPLYPYNEKTLANLYRSYFLRSHSGDEQMTIASLASMRPSRLDFNPKFFAYGGAYVYTVGAALMAADIVNIVHLKKDLSFYFVNPDEMGKIFVFVRSLNALFCLITLIIIFFFVKESFSPLAALLAVLFIAICPGIVFQCHILKPYTLGVMFFSACLFFSGRLVRDSSRRNYIYSGIFAGLCAGAMSVYGPVFLAPLAAHFISEKKDHSNLIYLILFSALAFCLVNPYWAIDFNSMRAEMKDSAGWYTKGITASQIIKYIFGQIPGNISWGLFIVAAAGVVYAFFSKNRILIMLLSVSLVPSVLFLYLLNQQQQVLNVSRFLLPWTVAALILGACFVDFILNSKWKAAAVILLFLFVIVPSTLHSLAVVKNFAVDASDRSTRLMAGKWIMANIPPDATIGIYGMPQPAGIPPFDFSRYKLIYIRNMQATKMSEAQYIVTINLNNNEIDQSCTQDFEILKSFDQEESILGLKFRILRSNINSRVDIFKRVL